MPMPMVFTDSTDFQKTNIVTLGKKIPNQPTFTYNNQPAMNFMGLNDLRRSKPCGACGKK